MRLDKWLWAARFFKTRTLAAEAIGAGHISVNGERAKAAKALRLGDEVRVRKAPFEHTVIVKGLSEQRGSATIAAGLFEETEESRARRTALAAEMQSLHGHAPRFKGRPTKKTRREYEKWLHAPDEE